MTASVPEDVSYAAVLVPLDGSHLAATALTHAVALARSFGAKVVLLHAMPPESRSEPSLERQALRAQSEAYLDGLKRSMAGYGVPVEWCVVEGMPARTIIEAARATSRAIIVMSRVGRTASLPRAAGQTYGAVTGEIVRGWDGPLLLVNPYA